MTDFVAPDFNLGLHSPNANKSTIGTTDLGICASHCASHILQHHNFATFASLRLKTKNLFPVHLLNKQNRLYRQQQNKDRNRCKSPITRVLQFPKDQQHDKPKHG